MNKNVFQQSLDIGWNRCPTTKCLFIKVNEFRPLLFHKMCIQGSSLKSVKPQHLLCTNGISTKYMHELLCAITKTSVISLFSHLCCMETPVQCSQWADYQSFVNLALIKYIFHFLFRALITACVLHFCGPCTYCDPELGLLSTNKDKVVSMHGPHFQ